MSKRTDKESLTVKHITRRQMLRMAFGSALAVVIPLPVIAEAVKAPVAMKTMPFMAVDPFMFGSEVPALVLRRITDGHSEIIIESTPTGPDPFHEAWERSNALDG